MEAASSLQWHLQKYDGDREVFGPMQFEKLLRWASSAQVAPNDCVSSDQVTWMKAPMLAELGMDWLVEVTSERFYGPTTIGAVQEFLRLGEINEKTFVINTCDGTRQQVGQLELPSSPAEEAESTAERRPVAGGMSIDPQQRIRELEQALREERRALAEAEVRCQQLQAQLDSPSAVG